MKLFFKDGDLTDLGQLLCGEFVVALMLLAIIVWGA
jgi:hypothetical protein